jgi:hypothetical protein
MRPRPRSLAHPRSGEILENTQVGDIRLGCPVERSEAISSSLPEIWPPLASETPPK